MDFNAKQMREDALVAKGRYRYRVLIGREKRTSSGNDMMSLKLHVYVNERPNLMWANLLFIPKMFWFVEHFCKSCGMPEKIEEGRLMAQDCDNREGYLDVDHRVNKDTGEVEAFVKDFVKPEDLDNGQNVDNLFDDQVPNFA